MTHGRYLKRSIATVALGNAMLVNGICDAPKVELRESSGHGWQLMRDGTRYQVKGVGGSASLVRAKELGANSVRFWGIQQLAEKNASGKTNLEEIEELGLTFCAGIWVQHPRHGFSYVDPEQVKEQQQTVRDAVRRYKDHPNLLVWGLGNEAEISLDEHEAVSLWQELEELAKTVKAEDPHHPVMTVIAGAGENTIRGIMAHYPSIDILGINAYRGGPGIAARLRDLGWKKPFLLTEFGPPGHWEVPKTPWGAPLEPTANEKAELYAATLDSMANDPAGLGLGGYAFLWGNKQETTRTWYGMLLASGEKLPAVDVLGKAWTGRWPANRSPVVSSLQFERGAERFPAGSKVKALAKISDPERDTLTCEWSVMAESQDVKLGGDAESVPASFPDAVEAGVAGPACLVTIPPAGAYRLFLVVRDGKGGASTANVPFLSE